jgi:glycosyltransferase involved in cell wall biosynthesis
VGDRHYYKNFVLFVESISSLLKREDDLFLVCAGGKDFNNDEKYLFEKLQISNKVLSFPLLDDSILSMLYTRALCFIFPSLYEGFGIPVLEAFACGCPAILSNSSSLLKLAVEQFYILILNMEIRYLNL